MLTELIKTSNKFFKNLKLEDVYQKRIWSNLGKLYLLPKVHKHYQMS